MTSDERMYRIQTSMLQRLRRGGHKVDFSPVPTFDAVPPGGFVPPATPTLRQFEGKRCPYCQIIMARGARDFPTRDHFRPRRAGGTLANGNCVVVCAKCNNDKADMMPAEFVAWLEKRSDPRAEFVKALIPTSQGAAHVTRGVSGAGPQRGPQAAEPLPAQH